MRRLRQQNPLLVQAEAVERATQQHSTRALPEAGAAALIEGGGLRFELLGDGLDARVLDGRFPGAKVSELASTSDGRDYLGSVWRVLPMSIQDVVRRYFSD